MIIGNHNGITLKYTKIIIDSIEYAESAIISNCDPITVVQFHFRANRPSIISDSIITKNISNGNRFEQL
jgi:hypothetical protein